jgi:hypothetical protein
VLTRSAVLAAPGGGLQRCERICPAPAAGCRPRGRSPVEESCMQLQNEFTVPAPVPEVWKTLLDAQRIGPCLPG